MSDDLRTTLRSAGGILAAGLLAMQPSGAGADPAPGDVYRETTFKPNGTHFSEIDPACKRENVASWVARARADRELEVAGLEGATHAEVAVEYWGGHIGTGGQAFRVNGNDWIPIQQPTTPTAASCYYRTLLGRPSVPLPLDQLRPGRNVFQFAAGPQIKYGFDWGFYWIYAFTLRLYYDPAATPHPRAEVVLPPGGELGEAPAFALNVKDAPVPIRQVDYIGLYEGFNWEGDGEWRRWHYQLRRGELARHIGTATEPPYRVTWDTTWVPDQPEPVQIMARVVDENGLCTLTPAATAPFRRAERSVRLVKPEGVPERFGVRVGHTMACKLVLSERALGQSGDAKLKRAVLVLSTWSGAHGDAIALNERKLVERVGVVHNVSFDAIPVPLDCLRLGDNVFSIYSATKEHALEVNWPGPALLLEYEAPAAGGGTRN